MPQDSLFQSSSSHSCSMPTFPPLYKEGKWKANKLWSYKNLNSQALISYDNWVQPTFVALVT